MSSSSAASESRKVTTERKPSTVISEKSVFTIFLNCSSVWLRM